MQKLYSSELKSYISNFEEIGTTSLYDFNVRAFLQLKLDEFLQNYLLTTPHIVKRVSRLCSISGLYKYWTEFIAFFNKILIARESEIKAACDKSEFSKVFFTFYKVKISHRLHINWCHLYFHMNPSSESLNMAAKYYLNIRKKILTKNCSQLLWMACQKRTNRNIICILNHFLCPIGIETPQNF